MTEPSRPVPLRPGALRALLRQPDLPPDLVAKISARADHLARAEQRRGTGANSWNSRPRWSIILPVLAGLAVTAGVAFLLSPVPPEAAPAAPAREETSAPSGIAAAPRPVDPAPPETTATPVMNEQPIVDVAPTAKPVPTEAIPAPPASRRPASSSRATVTGAKASPTVAARTTNGTGKAAERQHGESGQKNVLPVSPVPNIVPPPGSVAGPLSGAISEPPPAMPVDLPVVVPMIELPAQP